MKKLLYSPAYQELLEELVLLPMLCGLLAWFYLRHPPVWGANDDVGMMMIAAGIFDNIPDGRLIFINVLIGWPIAVLYRLFHALPWYALAQAFALAAGIWGILASCWKPGLRWPGMLVTSGVVVYGLMPMLQMMTFTMSAFVVFLGAVACYVRGTGEADSSRQSRYLYYAMGLTWLAFLWRSSVLYLGLLVAMPLIVACTWSVPKTKLVKPILGLVGLITAAMAIDFFAYYVDTDWRNYREFNAARSKIHDVPRNIWVADGAERLARVGLSAADVTMLNSWNFYDPKVFTAERLQKLVQEFPAGQSGWTESSRELEAIFTENRIMFQIILWLAALGILLAKSPRRLAVLLCINAFVILLTFILLAHYVRLPSRVYVPTLVYWSLIPVYWLLFDAVRYGFATTPLSSHRVNVIQIVGLTLLAVLFGRSEQEVAKYASRNQLHEGRNAEWLLAIAQLERATTRLPHNTALVSIGATFPIHLIPPFDNGERLRDLNLVPGGWGTFSGVYFRTLRRHGLEDIYRSCYKKGNLVLNTGGEGNLQQIADFMERHYGERIQFTILDRTPYGIFAKGRQR